MKRFPCWRAAFILFILGYGLHAHHPIGSAQVSTIPNELQAAIFAKVFNYDKRMRQSKAKLKVAIMISDRYSKQAGSLARSFNKVNVETVFIKADEVNQQAANVSAIYVFDPEQANIVEKACYQHKVLSISGNSALVEAGKVAVAIGISKSKPQIVIHLNRGKKEGHIFSAQLLKLAKVLQ